MSRKKYVETLKTKYRKIQRVYQFSEYQYVCPQFAMSRMSGIQNHDGCPVSLLCRGHKQQPAALEDLPSDCTQQLPDHVDSSAPICPADSPSLRMIQKIDLFG